MANAIQEVSRALLVYTGIQRLANALTDGDRIRRFAMTFGLLAAKAIAAAAVIVPLTGAIGNLIPLIMLAAPAAATAGLAMVGFKLALNGVKDALDAGLSGDTEEFEKALKKLPPSAAHAVRAMVDVRDAWKPLARDFQSRVFEGAGGEIKGLSDLIKPIAEKWLPLLGNKFAQVRNQLAEGLASFTRSGQLEAVWRNLHIALSDILDTVKPLARAFGDVLYVAAPRFAKVAEYIREAATAFSNWIRSAKESGQLAKWLDKAMDTFGKLKDIAVNLGKIIGAVFRASGEEGDGMLDQIERVTAAFAEWANGKDGQKLIDILAKIFQLLAQLGPAIEVITAIWSAMFFIASEAWNGILGIAKFVIMWILNGYGWLLEGGAKAFSWVPGVGDKLKKASEDFNKFRDSVNNSLNGINKTIDIYVNYRARMIGPHMARGDELAGEYRGGGGRASGGPAAGLMRVGEQGIETIDFTRGMVYNSNQTKRAEAAMGRGGGGVTVLQPVFEATPGTMGAAVASLMKSALQSNQVRLRIDSSGYVAAAY
jgi:hypothetical protein